jgi:hypothetical protein
MERIQLVISLVNPSYYTLLIHAGYGKSEIKIFRQTGELVLIEMVDDRTSIHIDMSCFSAGLYVITMADKSVKIIKK